MYMRPFLVWKNACFKYREFDLEGDLVGVPHTWYLSAQSFITQLKLFWRELYMGAMDNWKKKCVGLQWKWVSKRTVLSPAYLEDCFLQFCRQKCLWFGARTIHFALQGRAVDESFSSLYLTNISLFKTNLINQSSNQIIAGPRIKIQHYQV